MTEQPDDAESFTEFDDLPARRAPRIIAMVAAALDKAFAISRAPAVAIAVRLPITGTRDTQVKTAILRQLDRLKAKGGGRGVLVLQFDTSDEEGALASDFGSFGGTRIPCSFRFTTPL